MLRTKRSKIRILGVIVVIFILGASAVLYKTHHTANPNNVSINGALSQKAAANLADHPGRIRLILSGDSIAHDSVNAAAKRADGSYDYVPLMKDFVPVLAKSDIRFCNDPILNGGEALGITGYPKFNSPTSFVTDLGKLGCNLVNTASNHSFDFAQANISASVAAWQGVPNMLAVAGENRNQVEHDAVHYFTLKGVKFAFLAYTSYSNSAPQNGYGVNSFSQAFATSQIATAKAAGAQFIIASMRWGTEYSGTVNALQKQQAQFLADQGVQLVIGHGPHVLQPVQELTGANSTKSLVFYSIGNFINTQEPPETLFNGLPVMDIDAKTLAISNIRFLPLYMHYEWTAAEAAADQINTRTHVQMYLLEQATQTMVDAQQLHTTIAAQKQRLSSTLNALGMNIPLITSQQYYDE